MMCRQFAQLAIAPDEMRAHGGFLENATPSVSEAEANTRYSVYMQALIELSTDSALCFLWPQLSFL